MICQKHHFYFRFVEIDIFLGDPIWFLAAHRACIICRLQSSKCAAGSMVLLGIEALTLFFTYLSHGTETHYHIRIAVHESHSTQSNICEVAPWKCGQRLIIFLSINSCDYFNVAAVKKAENLGKLTPTYLPQYLWPLRSWSLEFENINPRSISPESGTSVPMQPVNNEATLGPNDADDYEHVMVLKTSASVGVLRPQSSFSGTKLG